MCPTVTDVPWSICVTVCMCVCLLVTTVSPTKTAEPIQIPDVVWGVDSGRPLPRYAWKEDGIGGIFWPIVKHGDYPA